MAVTLILYPDPEANSFISLEDANTFLEQSLGYPEWSKLDPDTQSRWLIYAYSAIIYLEDLVLPEDAQAILDGCLPKAQAALALHSLLYGTNDLGAKQQIRTEKSGPLSIEYFKNIGADALSVDDYPKDVMFCLSEYGVTNPNYPGVVNSFRKTR